MIAGVQPMTVLSIQLQVAYGHAFAIHASMGFAKGSTHPAGYALRRRAFH
jgi:hypothetical protein